MATPDKFLTGVTRTMQPGERSWAQVIYQSGKRVFDAELQLEQDIRKELGEVLRRKGLPSGWVKTQQRKDSLTDFTFPGTTTNAFNMSKQLAMVAGYPVTVEYSNTTTAGTNIIQLAAPPTLGGAAPDTKRSDFVFLEVWLAEVAPSPRATGTLNIATNPAALDTVTIDGTVLTAVAGAPGANQFQIGASETITATNLAAAIDADVATANGASEGPLVIVKAAASGAAGNAITLATSVPAKITLSGATLAGGVDTANKPTQDLIYRHGNVLAPNGVNFADDLADPTLDDSSTSADVLTTRRVQVQYRIRTVSTSEASPGGVSFKTEPEGFSNAAVLAQGAQASPVATYPFVRADLTTVSGNSDATAYDVEDPGLWVAGSGSSASATALGSVDGFVYAIPLAFVFRRNDDTTGAGFDPLDNTNGGLLSTHGGVAVTVGAIPAGLSDRPDGAFVDIINAQDVLDLRRHVSPVGTDLAAELDYQMQMLLDGRNLTWAIDSEDKSVLGNGSGDISTQFLVCNQIGRKAGVGGVAPGSGTTTRGPTIRNFDHVSRRFGTQPVVERFVIEFLPTYVIGTHPGHYVVQVTGVNTTWAENDALHLDFTGLDASTEGDFDIASTSWVSANKEVWDLVPTGTKITDILGAWHDDGHITAAIDQTVQFKTITGLGTGHVIMILDRNETEANLNLTTGAAVAAHPLTEDTLGSDDGSLGRIFVEVEVTYPLGIDSGDGVTVGLTDTPDLELSPDATVYPHGPLLENSAAQRPTDMEDQLAPNFREGYREVQLEYVANNGTATNAVTDTIVSINPTTMRFPRRVHGAVAFPATVTETLTATARSINNAATDYGSSSRLVTTAALTNTGQTLVDIEYFPQDAIPNFGAGGYQVGVYYRSNAPQTVGIRAGAATPELPSTLVVEPLVTANYLWSAQTGKGSVDLPFPYTSPLDQIPVNDNGTGNFGGEWYFAATASISIDDFDAEVGMLNLHTFTPIDGTDDLSLTRSAATLQDAEFRAFYDGISANFYRPTAFAQHLSGVVRHKVFLPFLVRATTDTELFRKNEVLLLVLSRWAELDDENTLRFTDSDNFTAVGVYRTKNLLLIAGD